MTDLSELEALVGRVRLPVQAIETPDYAELFDEDGTKVALTVQPELVVAAVNALPHLISTIRSQEALLREVIEAAGGIAKPGCTMDFLRNAPAEVAAIKAERDALRAALVEAREALEPFAKMAASVLRSPRKGFADDYDWATRQDGTKITFGHLRRAACALSKLEGR